MTTEDAHARAAGWDVYMSHHAVQHLQSAVWQCLDWGLVDGAQFAAERLAALSPGPESRYLTALVLTRQRLYRAAHAVLAGETHIPSVYLFAQCCLEMEKFNEGIVAVESARPTWSRSSPAASTAGHRNTTPSPAAMNLILGKLYLAVGDKSAASQALALSAKDNPYLWESVATLCTVPGVDVKIESLFPVSDTLAAPRAAGPSNTTADPFLTPQMPPPPIIRRTAAHAAPRLVPNGASTPLNFGVADITPSPGPTNAPDAGMPSTPMRPPPQPRRILGDLAFTPKAKLESTPNVLNNSLGANTWSSTNTSMLPSAFTGVSPLVSQIYERFAAGTKQLARFECQCALKELADLPKEQRSTPLALALEARCHFELMDYKASATVYENLRKVDPYRVRDMEHYSTVLWQLKRNVDLAYLAHEMYDIDRLAWQTCCVMGNSFSLNHDPTHALECFKRALQLYPKCSTAYTLQGHEYMANEELQNAQDAFRMALRMDPSNYNAWYGLGMVFLRLGDIDQAELHFSQALRINPHNAILICFVGTVFEKKGLYPQALAQYKRACALHPSSAVARFKMAEALMEAKLYSQALEELECLLELAPEDASVHFVLGKVYRALDKRPLAIKHLTIALNLDPRAGTAIKAELVALTA